MSKKVYDLITNVIIEKLEEGNIPWQKPFLNQSAVNWVTQKEYRGINVMLLESGEYATFKQISEAGGKVKKGSKGSIVVFWKLFKNEDEETGEERIVPMLRYYKVFKVGKQTEGIEPKRKEIKFSHDPIGSANKLIELYEDKPVLKSSDNSGAYYSPSEDFVNVPVMDNFPNVEDYYNTMFHELVHSTGHRNRLNREGVTNVVQFGSERYSKEELVAEIGAAMLCGIAEIENKTIDNSVSYIQSWLRALKNDSTLIVTASQQAQKASDYVQGIKHKDKALT